MTGLYVPAGLGREPVAGDFYEVLPLDDDVVALLVGDVTGHGRMAVGRMRKLRSAARAYALERLGPASVLARLDRFMESSDDEAFATLWYGEYRLSGALTYASAGHPPPASTPTAALCCSRRLMPPCWAPASGTHRSSSASRTFRPAPC